MMDTHSFAIILNAVIFYGSIIAAVASAVRLLFLLVNKLRKKKVEKKSIVKASAVLSLSILLMILPVLFQQKRANIGIEEAKMLSGIALEDIRRLPGESALTPDGTEGSVTNYSIVVDGTEFNLSVTEDVNNQSYNEYSEKTSGKNLGLSERVFAKGYKVDDALVYVCPSDNAGSFDNFLYCDSYINSVYVLKDGYFITIWFQKAFVQSELLKNFTDAVRTAS